MYELSEDQLIMMQFLSGNGRTTKEFTDFRPDNKIWNDYDSTRLFIELAGADFIDDSDQTIMRLSDKGETFLRGYLQKKELENEEKDLQIAKLRLDVSNAKRINSTYWWTFSFAVIGFIISLVLLMLRISE
jgi:hypothetical protein